MSHKSHSKEAMRWIRLLERQKYISSWTPDEARAYHVLGHKGQRRYDSRVHRWIDGKLDGSIPLIPGTSRSTCPSTDAYCADKSAALVS
ncbi:MAG: hypothetical protein ABJQ29_15675 [Luteolibacter sp.]